MAKFEVLILPIDKVENHPGADRLSLNYIRGYVAVSNKLDDGRHRYRPGQLVAYVPEGSILSAGLLRTKGYWDEPNSKGFLWGEDGNIVKAITLRRVLSQGLIFPTEEEGWVCTGLKNPDDLTDPIYREVREGETPNKVMSFLRNDRGERRWVVSGDNVTAFLGIQKYENFYSNEEATDWKPFRTSYDDKLQTIHYEIEDLKKFPDLLKGKQVIATEMLHGILCIIGYDRRMDDPFFVADPLSDDGLVLDTSDGMNNIYVQTAKPIWEDIKRYLKEMPAVERFYLFGEIIGPDIQDLTYGLEETEFRAIDVQMGFMGGGRDSIPFGFIGVRKYELFKWLNIASVPVVWAGEYDYDAIHELANAPSTIGGGIRKGVVVTAEDENFIEGLRPILKLLSDKFLIRKNGTDFK